MLLQIFLDFFLMPLGFAGFLFLGEITTYYGYVCVFLWVIADSPASAQVSSTIPERAPDTPIAPISSLPNSMIAPPARGVMLLMVSAGNASLPTSWLLARKAAATSDVLFSPCIGARATAV